MYGMEVASGREQLRRVVDSSRVPLRYASGREPDLLLRSDLRKHAISRTAQRLGMALYLLDNAVYVIRRIVGAWPQFRQRDHLGTSGREIADESHRLV